MQPPGRRAAVGTAKRSNGRWQVNNTDDEESLLFTLLSGIRGHRPGIGSRMGRFCERPSP